MKDEKYLGSDFYCDLAIAGKLDLEKEYESDAVLEVVSYNQRAIRFYEKFGFEKVAGSERMYRDKMPVMTMIRKGAA